LVCDKTKKELILEDPEYKEIFNSISNFMAPSAFYDVVTGVIDFQKVEQLITHQMSLF